MAGFWPTPMAAASMPTVAARMNAGRKLVVSRTMKAAAWNNTRLLSGDLPAEVRRLKGAPGESITVLGSGSSVAQLTQADLIDEYQIVVNPVILGAGKTLFAGAAHAPKLELRTCRTFKNGKVFLTYARRDG